MRPLRVAGTFVGHRPPLPCCPLISRFAHSRAVAQIRPRGFSVLRHSRSEQYVSTSAIGARDHRQRHGDDDALLLYSLRADADQPSTQRSGVDADGVEQLAPRVPGVLTACRWARSASARPPAVLTGLSRSSACGSLRRRRNSHAQPAQVVAAPPITFPAPLAPIGAGAELHGSGRVDHQQGELRDPRRAGTSLRSEPPPGQGPARVRCGTTRRPRRPPVRHGTVTSSKPHR